MHHYHLHHHHLFHHETKFSTEPRVCHFIQNGWPSSLLDLPVPPFIPSRPPVLGLLIYAPLYQFLCDARDPTSCLCAKASTLNTEPSSQTFKNICITTDHNTHPLSSYHHHTFTVCHSLFENLTILRWTRERMSLISQNLNLPVHQI